MALQCTRCGTDINGGAERCPSCGTLVAAAPVTLSKDAASPAPPVVSLGKVPVEESTAVVPPVVSFGKSEAPVEPPVEDPYAWTKAPQPAVGPTPAPGPPVEDSNRRKWIIGLVAALVLVVIAFAAGILMNDDDSEPTVATSEPSSSASPVVDPTEEPTDTFTEEPVDEPTPEPTVAGPEVTEKPIDTTGAESQLTALTGEDSTRASELEDAGVWVAQLASSGPGESAEDFLTRYDDLAARYPDAIVIWSGDWPGSFGPSSANSWVVLNAGLQESTTQPVLDWCAAEGWEDGQCWAKRLDSVGDDPSLNTDHFPADDRNN